MDLLVSLYPYARWDSTASMTRAVRRMDELGFYGMSFADHVALPAGETAEQIGANWPDTLIMATYFAAITRKLRFVYYAMVVPYRNPVVLAKQIATLDRFSGGRSEFAVGAGWFKDEFDLVGAEFADRGTRLDEYIAAMRTLWSSDQATYRGRYVSFEKVLFEPKPVQRPGPPILIAGSGRRPLARVLETGDGWAPMVGSVDELRRDIGYLRSERKARGQDPDSMKFMYSVQIAEGDAAVRKSFAHAGSEGDIHASTGSSGDLTAQTVETLNEYASAGITQMLLVFGWETADDYIANLEWLAADVMPKVSGSSK
jgi:probable F420-dependent oxidoreductase